MPSLKTATGQLMRTRTNTDTPGEKAIRKKLIRPRPNWDHDLGKLVQGSDPHTYMKRTYEMTDHFDAVTEGIFGKLWKRKKNKLQQLRKRLSDDLPAKMKRQKFQAYMKQYGAAETGKKLKEELIAALIEQGLSGGRGSLGGGFGTTGRSSTRFGGGSGGKSMGTISNVGGKVTGTGKLGGGFGTRGSGSTGSAASISGGPGGVNVGAGTRPSGSGTNRFSGVSTNSGAMSGSTYNRGSTTYGGGGRRLGGGGGASRPTPTPARTSGGRMGGGDSRNVGRASPGSRRPGQMNNPQARANPTARGGSPLGRRGSVYGGNRQFRAGSNSPMNQRGQSNPENQRTSWWKR